MFDSILVICTGNICRSPMGEYLLRHRLGRPQVRVASAGTAALVQHPADADAIAVMRAHGIDMEAHRARQVTGELLAAHELVLTMEEHHSRWLLGRFPTARGRVFPIRHWVQAEGAVPDPYCQGREAFEQTWTLLEEAVDAWVQRL